MTVHERAVGGSVEWYTPASLFERLGLTFDLDPASPVAGPLSWVPAKRFISVGGEDEPWIGRVWLNPPYGPAGVRFIVRMIEHNHGLMLLPARTETRIFQAAARFATRVIFLSDRLHFVRPDGTASRASFGSVLMAYGRDKPMLMAVDQAALGWGVGTSDAA
jgi:DNA N-6-adenine-methyltransferase Dam